MLTVETTQDLARVRGLLRVILAAIPQTASMAGLADELTDDRLAAACRLVGIKESVLVQVQPGAQVEAVADMSGGA